MKSKTISVTAILAGSVSFVVLIMLYFWMVKGLEGNTGPAATVITWLLVKIFILLLTGYITGWTAKVNGIINAAVVAFLIPVLMGLVFAYFDVQHGARHSLISAIIISWAIPSVIFCTFGGYLWDRRYKKKAA